MANHVRRQIREAIGTAVTGLTTTGTRVFQSRVYPLQDTELPALLVYSQSESILPTTIHGPAVLDRTLRVRVAGIAKATADLDDTLDQIAKEVEVALSGPPAGLLALVRVARLTDTEIEMTGTAEQPVGRIELSYELEYFTAENAPDVAL